jgi:DNA-directed RNA polymerase subunit RPC12/RpoP
MPFMRILYLCFECMERVHILPATELSKHVVHCANCGIELDDDEVNDQ